MTYQEALTYIHSVSWKGSRPGLSRITELCERLGHPEASLRFVHVAGTNGKGSVCRMLASILEKAGYRTGLYTSPFIEAFNERIMYNGQNISDADLADATEIVRVQADRMEDSPTEFELITAIALVYYQKKACDYVVFECGLGGRLDSTNVIQTSVLSVITGIDLDHTALLGDTPAAIAAEKAGIIKEGVPVLFGEGADAAEEVIRAAAEAHHSPYVRTDFAKISDIRTDLHETTFCFDGQNVSIRLPGLYQTRNTATVLTAVDLLRKQGLHLPEPAVREGLWAARWKARLEILCEPEPLVVYDGAHNPQGIRGAAENIRQYLAPLTEDGKILLLMGVMADKDHRQMIEILAPLTCAVYTVTPANERSLDASDVCAEFADCGVAGQSFACLQDGVRAAVRTAAQEKRPLLCLGSLYMYADVKQAVRKTIQENI